MKNHINWNTTDVLPEDDARVLFVVAYDEKSDQTDVLFSGNFHRGYKTRTLEYASSFCNDDEERDFTDGVYDIDYVTKWIYANDIL